MRIDAHQHFWRIGPPWHKWPTADLPAIYRDLLPSNLSPLIDAIGIDATVLVQSQPSDHDTDWLLDLAARTAFVAGVVGWVDMKHDRAPARIAALAARPKFVGLRPMLQGLADDWILDPRAAPSIEALLAHDLAFDALIRPHHLSAIAALAERYPSLRIVIDHAAKPGIAADAMEPWAAELARAAANPNVFVKLSGLVTEDDKHWSVDRLRRYVQHVLESFGPRRVMWGSDWPVVLLRADYSVWWQVAREMVPAEWHAGVFGDNAAAIYRLTGIAGQGACGGRALSDDRG